jgi:release factor glutamine methyltransferase
VEQALQQLPADSDRPVLDLGTGSGAIAAAIAHERPRCVVTATDHNPASLEIAKQNFARLCPDRIRTLSSDWFSGLDADTDNYAVIVSNPPYVATSETHLTDRELAFEPEMALYSGADGLDAIRIICAQAPDYLMAHGWLILEHGFAQAEAVADLMSAQGFSNVRTYDDLSGIPRVTEAQLG